VLHIDNDRDQMNEHKYVRMNCALCRYMAYVRRNVRADVGEVASSHRNGHGCYCDDCGVYVMLGINISLCVLLYMCIK
jgi:hypothetical protein